MRVTVKETNLDFGQLTERIETKRLVIHHIGDIDREVTAEEVHRWHKGNGWSGIGYHYLVHKDGTIERGRPRDTVGSHAYGFNSESVGINIVGDFEQGTPTDAQIESASMLLADLCDIYSLEPTESVIVGHRDLMSTTCPGKNLYAILDILRGKAMFYKLQGGGQN